VARRLATLSGTQDQLLRLIGRMPPGGTLNSILTQFRKAP
jgi:hypothetical protein